jgi:polysaccharide deacetylase family protein (PEP-CTERM system associated)
MRHDEFAAPKVLDRGPNFFTVDVEEYFHVNYARCDTSSLRRLRTGIEAQIDRLLSLFDDAGIRCTFFALGEVGEKYPSVIRRIHCEGHEVASHGYGHDTLREMTPAGFGVDLNRSCGILEDLTGEKVSGYRAPSFSVTREMLPWFYDVLARREIEYSSSVFPGRTFLYGIPDFPPEPHYPLVDGRAMRVMELPITAFRLFHKRLPLYVRLLPATALNRQLRVSNRAGRPGMLYVHPREIDADQPRLPLSRLQSFIHYWGVNGCEAKLRRVAAGDLGFVTMREYVHTSEER